MVEGVRSAAEVLRAGEVEEANERGKVVPAEFLIDVFVEPAEQEGVERLGQVVAVIRCAVRVEEDGTQFLLDELGLVAEGDFQGG